MTDRILTIRSFVCLSKSHFQYWVSQGNKWCDFCKIFISNNPSTIRNHELGQRHKDNVAKKLANMRKENAAKDKEQKEAVRAIEQIEAVSEQTFYSSYLYCRVKWIAP